MLHGSFDEGVRMRMRVESAHWAYCTSKILWQNFVRYCLYIYNLIEGVCVRTDWVTLIVIFSLPLYKKLGDYIGRSMMLIKGPTDAVNLSIKSKPNVFLQILPYFVVEVLGKTVPGLPGVFVACLFCATLRYYFKLNIFNEHHCSTIIIIIII